MPVHVDKLIDVLIDISNNRGLKATVCGSARGGLITGGSAALGGLLLGPVGLALGGMVGGGYSALSARNKFKSVAVVLYEMTPHQKQELFNKIRDAFSDFGVQDLTALATLVLSTTSLQELAMMELTNYLRNNMNLAIS